MPGAGGWCGVVGNAGKAGGWGVDVEPVLLSLEDVEPGWRMWSLFCSACACIVCMISMILSSLPPPDRAAAVASWIAPAFLARLSTAAAAVERFFRMCCCSSACWAARARLRVGVSQPGSWSFLGRKGGFAGDAVGFAADFAWEEDIWDAADLAGDTCRAAGGEKWFSCASGATCEKMNDFHAKLGNLKTNDEDMPK